MLDVSSSRRSILLGGLALALPLPAAAAPVSSAFDIWWRDRRIGHHSVALQSSGGTTTASIDVRVTVKLGPIPLLDYSHAGTELWRDGRFVTLDTHSVVNGRHEQLHAERNASGVLVRANGKPDLLLAADTSPLTHWNVKAMAGPLFNPQNGKVMRERVKASGLAPSVLADGRTLPATAYTLSGEAQITDWYDERECWISLRARTPGGGWLDYKRTA